MQPNPTFIPDSTNLFRKLYPCIDIVDTIYFSGKSFSQAISYFKNGFQIASDAYYSNIFCKRNYDGQRFQLFTKIRSSRSHVFFKKPVLKYFAQVKGKHMCTVFFLILMCGPYFFIVSFQANHLIILRLFLFRADQHFFSYFTLCSSRTS